MSGKPNEPTPHHSCRRGVLCRIPICRYAQRGLALLDGGSLMSHEKRGESDEWYTPKYVFDALGERFTLDVASPPEGPRHVPADVWISEGSLERDWWGFVWMNPPFGHQSTKRAWLRKFFDHGNGIALLPDRTSAPWWQEFAPIADAVLFVAPKIKFERPDGTIGESPGTGTTLFASGNRARSALIRASSLGHSFTIPDPPQ